MSKQQYVSLFQSPSTAKRKAVIWKEIPKNKIDLKYYVVEQIELNGLPQDSVLGDVFLVDESCIDIIQEWLEYKVSIERVHDMAIDSLKFPKRKDENGFNTHETSLNIYSSNN